MSTYVLVHGGFHGGWYWKKLTPLLEEAGHTVYTPTLTGLGERADLATPDVGLSTHIQDIVDLIEDEDLHEVILVGHSYGGMVITGVADRIPDRIAHLVYLDSFTPEDGESVADISPLHFRLYQRWARKRGDGWQVPPPSEGFLGSNGYFGITEEPDLSWVLSNVTSQPLKTFEECLHLTQPEVVASLPRTYIHCTGVPFILRLIRRFILPGLLPPTGENWRHRKLPTGHNAMITMPEELADFLLESNMISCG